MPKRRVSSAGEAEVEQLPNRAWAAGCPDDRQRAARVVVEAGAADDREIEELPEAHRATGDELALRQGDRGGAHPSSSGHESADEAGRADWFGGDLPIEELVVDDLLVARGQPAAAYVHAGVAELPIGDPDEVRTGGGNRVQARVYREPSDDREDGEQP